MKRESVLKSICDEYRLSNDNSRLLADFIKENKDINEHDFYDKLKSSFPWLEYSIRFTDSSRLRRINNHLLFFKVMTIISICIGLISLVVLAK